MLYYPFVTPPRPVLMQALLYWDSIASIVPIGMPPRPELEELGDLYLPLTIDDHRLRVDIDGMVNEVALVLGAVDRDSLQVRPAPLLHGNRLYYGKLPMAIELALQETGLAIPRPEALQVDEQVLGLVLAIAAKYLADAVQTPEHRVVTHTDRYESYGLAYQPLPVGRATWSWLLDLSTLLPIPDPTVPVPEVLRFREKHADEREAFLDAMRRMLTQLRTEVEEPAVPSELRKALKRSLRDYARARSARKWSWTTVTVSACVGLGATAGAALLVPPLAVGLASALGAFGINIATSQLRAGPSTELTYAYALSEAFPVG
jgi:hypothetical protein